MDEAQSGDFIIIRHPQTHVEEEQKIIYIMSQRSLNIANPFSSDLITTTNFYIGNHTFIVLLFFVECFNYHPYIQCYFRLINYTIYWCTIIG